MIYETFEIYRNETQGTILWAKFNRSRYAFWLQPATTISVIDKSTELTSDHQGQNFYIIFVAILGLLYTIGCMNFVFKAFTNGGEIVNSVIAAGNQQEAVTLLQRQHLNLISIAEEFAARSTTRQLFKMKQRKMTITNVVLLSFFEKLHKMLAAKITLSDAISIINKRTANSAEKTMTDKMLQDISGGHSFSDAIKNLNTKIDSNVYSIILVGESSGNLATVLEDVVDLLKSKNDLKKKMISSLAYPTFMISFTIAVMLIFVFVLMPKMEDFIKDLGGELPAMAQFLKSLAQWFTYLLLPAIALIILAAITMPKLRQTKIGRRKTDQLMLKIVPFSTIIPLFTQTSLTKLMATLLSNGVNTSDALTLAQTSIGNEILLEQFICAKTNILDGSSVCAAFEQHDVIDGELCDFLAIGEKVGDLATSFKDIHKIYDEKLQSTLKKLTVSISAAAMMFAFTLVGLLALGMVQSIMGATNAAI
ncbi:MAG: type II secretion system F family protein [Puniceicoccales bacterium]|jgi:type II secretory pathway component PulF|nr:type II secretion system F family protein [Puniceicoccales bacterium]